MNDLRLWSSDSSAHIPVFQFMEEAPFLWKMGILGSEAAGSLEFQNNRVNSSWVLAMIAYAQEKKNG